MVSNKKLDVIYSALTTPFHEDESLNVEALRKLVQFELENGVEGFYCCGSSGEGLLLSLDERKKVLETVLEEVDGSVPVISHIGTVATKDVIELAEHALHAGADAVSMIPPYYYNFSMNEIIQYYLDVVNAVNEIPVIVYNIPQFTGVSFNKNNAGRLLENDHVIGIKHTSTDLFGLERMKHDFPDKIYFNGFDEIFLSGLCAGANAAIGTTVNLYPKTFRRLKDLFEADRLEEAQKVQTLINHRVEEMVNVGIFSAVKYIFKKIGIDCGECRRPFAKLNEEQKTKLNQLIEEGFDIE
ncbi:MAG: N-acetylneuraminate lyase [Erysipelotrichaceae bacterium]|nr:N-acetylneuraminate lyase [Erysipelotrichaceae bacterium]